MIQHAKHIIFLLIILLASGCASSIRFSSDQTGETTKKNEPRATETLSRRSSDIETIEQKKEEKISADREKVVKIAQSWLGTPYVWGGNTRGGVDCSGLVKNVYEQIGINLPRTAQQQFEFACRINDRELRPGDLLFYRKGNKISHVAIYIGKGEIIHSSSSAKGVIKQSFNDNYLSSIYVGAGRVLH